ncbi:FAS1-like dehydratase domain-containing protein [Cupriavidus necator]
MSEKNYKEWIGRIEERTDSATEAPIRSLAATLDRPLLCVAGTPVPPLWHWTFFLPTAQTNELGSDGHPEKGGFLPPIELPRRMWAGSRLQFHETVRIGDALTRTSTVSDVTAKDGRSGSLVFVKVHHRILTPRGPAITEEQDIVYRAPAKDGTSAKAAESKTPVATWRHRVDPTPALLFRYSALTFNTHRIHFDRPYAQNEEGYAGLVVHGPLIATLLLEAFHRERPDLEVVEYAFRAASPLLDIHPFWLCGAPRADGTFDLWAEGHDGRIATIAKASVR